MTTSNATTRTVLSREVGTVEIPLALLPANVCVIQKKATLHLRDDGITVTKSELRSGMSTSGKRWYRWTRTHGYTADFRGRGNGPRRIFLYHYNSWVGAQNKKLSSFSDRSGFSQSWSEFFAFSPRVRVEFEARVRKFFPYLLDRVESQNPVPGMFGVLCAYPALNDFHKLYEPESQWFRVQTINRLQRGLREETATQCVRSVFGKTRTNRRLVRTLVDVESVEGANLAVFFKGKVPTDWISDALSGATLLYLLPSIDQETGEMLDKILSLIPEGRKRVFFFSIFSSGYTKDTLRLLTWNNRCPVEEVIQDVRTMNDLHAKCMDFNHRARTAKDNRTIPIKGISSKYHNIEIDGGYSCVAPTNTSEVSAWGSRMGNCIEGFAYPAVRNDLFLGAVFQGETMLANFEIDSKGNLIQLLGKHNQELTEDKRNAIIDALAGVEAIHLDTVTNAWGVPEYTPIKKRKLIEA